MTRNVDLRIPDLAGQLAVVTGASDGIGRVIASRLARAGAEVVMPVRTLTKGEIAVGLFARELDVRSRTGAWGVTSNLSHPGISPTHLLAAQPGMGRWREAGSRWVVRLLSRLGVAGSVESAALPALMGATDLSSRGNEFYGPKRVIGGGPARLTLWSPMRDLGDARRIWDESARLVGERFAV